MSSSEEEIDYMSEEFLSQCVGNNDVRPGLVNNHSTKRKNEIERKLKEDNERHRKKMKSVEEIQSEKLAEGLKIKIDTNNKGFALMQKMGYKTGTSLGKEGVGIIEPITVELKLDRVGFGWQQMIAEKKKEAEQRKKEKRKKKQEEMDPLKYRERLSNLHSQKLIESDLRKSRKVCYDLDSQVGLVEPHEYWFWPPYTWWENDDEEDDDEDGKDVDKNDKRRKYWWENDDEEDNEEEDDDEDGEDVDKNDKRCKYYLETDEVPEENSEKAKKKINREELEELYEPWDQLKILTSYLRSTYMYCVWCCTEFQDLEDMKTNCPGTTRVEHN